MRDPLELSLAIEVVEHLRTDDQIQFLGQGIDGEVELPEFDVFPCMAAVTCALQRCSGNVGRD